MRRKGFWVTQQRPDICFLKGVSYALRSFPLEAALAELGLEVDAAAAPPAPDCWRGYVATWALQDERLYLLSVRQGADLGRARFVTTRKVRHRLDGPPAALLSPEAAARLKAWLLSDQASPLAAPWAAPQLCLA
jgi:hypothetical protein